MYHYTLSSDEWRTSYTLAAVLSVLVFAVVSMTLLVCRLKTRKKKSTGRWRDDDYFQLLVGIWFNLSHFLSLTEKSGTCHSANTTLVRSLYISSQLPHYFYLVPYSKDISKQFRCKIFNCRDSDYF